MAGLQRLRRDGSLFVHRDFAPDVVGGFLRGGRGAEQQAFIPTERLGPAANVIGRHGLARVATQAGKRAEKRRAKLGDEFLKRVTLTRGAFLLRNAIQAPFVCRGVRELMVKRGKIFLHALELAQMRQRDAVELLALTRLLLVRVNDLRRVGHDAENALGDPQPLVVVLGVIVIGPFDAFDLVEIEDEAYKA